MAGARLQQRRQGRFVECTAHSAHRHIAKPRQVRRTQASRLLQQSLSAPKPAAVQRSHHARARGSATGGCASGGSAVGGTPIAYGGGAPVGGRSRPGLGLAKKGLGDNPADRGAKESKLQRRKPGGSLGHAAASRLEQRLHVAPRLHGTCYQAVKVDACREQGNASAVPFERNMQLQAVVKFWRRSATRQLRCRQPLTRDGVGHGDGHRGGPENGRGRGSDHAVCSSRVESHRGQCWSADLKSRVPLPPACPAPAVLALSQLQSKAERHQPHALHRFARLCCIGKAAHPAKLQHAECIGRRSNSSISSQGGGGAYTATGGGGA